MGKEESKYRYGTYAVMILAFIACVVLALAIAGYVPYDSWVPALAIVPIGAILWLLLKKYQV